MVRHQFHGYVIETLKSGNLRHRVRMEGNPSKKTTIPCGPDDPAFLEHYYAARAGEKHRPKPKARRRTFQWLCDEYLDHLETLAETGAGSPLTLRKRKSQLNRLCAMTDAYDGMYGDLNMGMPRAAFIQARNKMAKTPAEADNTMKAVRAMYKYGKDMGWVDSNPAVDIEKIHTSKGGAVAWTPTDLAKFKETHPRGSTAFLWLTLSMFTGCRIGDAASLGRANERVIDGQPWLVWKPSKKGSAETKLPIMPPLATAIKSMKIQGPTYLLNSYGQPFKNTAVLGTRVRRWCDEAGLKHLSAHGVRKGLAELLAEAGCSTHEIMAVLSHTKAQTSEVYTKGAERQILSASAFGALRGVEW